MLGESQRVDKKLARKIVRRLAWLGRRHIYKKFLILLLVYITGLVPALIVPIVVVILLWSPFFLDCFMRDDPTFPRLRTILSFPLRIGGLATTPLFPVYGVIPSIGDPIEILPYLIPALKIDDAYESDIDDLEGHEVRNAASKALDQIIDVLDIEAMPQLLVALRNKNEGVREYAAYALGKIGDAAAVPHLITAFRQDKRYDERYRVSWATANALLEIKDVTAIPHFIVASQDEDKNIRGLAVKALGKIGDVTVIPYLVIALQDEVVDVREATIAALGQIGDTTVIPHLVIALQDEVVDIRLAAAQALGQIGDASAIPHLVTDLQQYKVSWVRAAAGRASAEALVQILVNTADIPHLLTILQDQEMEMREAAAQALGQIGNASTIPQLITAMQEDKEYGVRRVAAAALGQIGDASAVPYLTTALQQNQDKEMGVRWVAAKALGQIGNAAAVPYLITALQQDKESSVRRAAAEALGQIGDVSAVPYLNIALQDRDYELRTTAAKALEQIDDIPTIPDLLMGLQASNKDLRVSSANLLGHIGDAAAVPHLLTALQDELEDVRVAAIKALGHIGDAAIVPHLLTALQDELEDVRVAAVKSLGQIGDEIAIPHLISLPNKPKRVRLVVVEAMGQIGHTSAVPYLITALQSGWEDVNQAAALSLGQIGDASAVSSLISTLHRDGAVWTRRAAAAALSNIAITVNDLSLLESIRHALWWQVSDISFTENTVAQAAYSALEQVANRITELSVSQLNLTDPLGPLPPPHPVRRWLLYSLWVVTTAIIAILIETVANLLSNILGSSFPAGTAGVLVLISALILFLSINRKLES
jgi:HEAT repeat protein